MTRRRLDTDTLLFCVLWAALAIAGVAFGGWAIGLFLAIALFLAISISTSLILSRSGDLSFERKMRWGFLAGGCVALLLYLATAG